MVRGFAMNRRPDQTGTSMTHFRGDCRYFSGTAQSGAGEAREIMVGRTMPSTWYLTGSTSFGRPEARRSRGSWLPTSTDEG